MRVFIKQVQVSFDMLGDGNQQICAGGASSFNWIAKWSFDCAVLVLALCEFAWSRENSYDSVFTMGDYLLALYLMCFLIKNRLVSNPTTLWWLLS